MAPNAGQVQLITTDLSQAFSAFFRAYFRSDGQQMLDNADRINRDLKQLGREPMILYPGYKLPET